MGARGPLPKRDRESVVTGHKPKGPSLGGDASVPPGTVPPLPARAPAAVQRAWKAFWSDSSLAALVGPSDHDVIYRWSRYRGLLEKALKDLEQGKEDVSVIDVQRLEKLCLSLEAALGIGPAARARLGVPSGTKSTADKLREAMA